MTINTAHANIIYSCLELPNTLYSINLCILSITLANVNAGNIQQGMRRSPITAKVA